MATPFPDAYLALLNSFPEALVLTSIDGIVLAANAAAAQTLSLDPQQFGQLYLMDRVVEPPEKLLDFLRLCARNRTMIPGAFSLRQNSGGPEAVYSVEGALAQPRSGQTDPVLILRWRPREQASHLFIELNQQIERLSREMLIREKEAEERARLYQEVQQFNAELERRVVERTAELEYSFKELDQFTHVVSHDLKAPLRAVSYLASWIVEDAAATLPDASREHLAKLQSRVKWMEKLLDDLLAYARIGRQGDDRREPVDTGLLIAEMIDLLSPPPGFTITVQENMPILRTHRVLLELVFRNLIENAIKYHDRADGRVAISIRALEGWVEFCVSDDGPGVDEIFHQRIFQIFQTLQPRDKGGGTGVGLAIVKKAVESQGGNIWLRSAKGEGATFCFTWPKGMG
jgi:signal transduction histidine kinase